MVEIYMLKYEEDGEYHEIFSTDEYKLQDVVEDWQNYGKDTSLDTITKYTYDHLEQFILLVNMLSTPHKHGSVWLKRARLQ